MADRNVQNSLATMLQQRSVQRSGLPQIQFTDQQGNPVLMPTPGAPPVFVPVDPDDPAAVIQNLTAAYLAGLLSADEVKAKLDELEPKLHAAHDHVAKAADEQLNAPEGETFTW